jgi:hypothetical protein
MWTSVSSWSWAGLEWTFAVIAPGSIRGRGLHSITFQLEVSACCGIGVRLGIA